MTSVWISEAGIARIAQKLKDAGDDWVSAALGIDLIEDCSPGDQLRRDQVTLRRNWGMPVNDGRDIAECPPVMYRDEDGDWHGLGWSNASRELLYRPPGATYDADAGVHTEYDE